MNELKNDCSINDQMKSIVNDQEKEIHAPMNNVINREQKTMTIYLKKEIKNKTNNKI